MGSALAFLIFRVSNMSWADKEERDLPPKGLLFLCSIIGLTVLGFFFQVLLLGFIVGLVLGSICEAHRHRQSKMIKARYQRDVEAWQHWLYSKRKKRARN